MFVPPFCPAVGCEAHFEPPEANWYRPAGTYTTDFRGLVHRFKCRLCGIGFSEQTFSIDYYAKRYADYRMLQSLLRSCQGIRQMARTLDVHRETIQNKVMRLSRQALAIHSDLLEDLELEEDLVADGLQSYWVSKYYPNNLTMTVGARSKMIYLIDGTTIRRSGVMTEAQKARRDELEKRYRADPKGIERSFTELAESFTRLIARGHDAGLLASMNLHTDEKKEYGRSLAAHGAWSCLAEQGIVRHQTTSSKARRDQHNPLEPVNYMEREIRKDLAEHVRKTVRYAKNANHSMERLALYSFAHNVLKRFRINQPASDQRSHYDHAVSKRHPAIERVQTMYTLREFRSRSVMVPPLQKVWLRQYETPLKTGEQYLPAFFLA
jgi:hypothetical protein